MNLHMPGLVEPADPRPEPSDLGNSTEAEAALRPAVASTSPSRAPWLVIGGSVLMGLLVLLFLSSRRGPPGEAPVNTNLPTGGSATVSAAPPPPQDLLLAEAAGRNPLYAPTGVQQPPVSVVPVAPANTAGPSGGLPSSTTLPSYGPLPSFSSTPVFTTAPAPAVTSSAAAAAATATAAQRRNAPVLVVDLARGTAASPASATSSAAAGQATGAVGAADAAGGPGGQLATGAAGAFGAGGQQLPGAGGLNGDEQFAQRVGAGEPERSRATMLASPGFVVPQGAMIPAVLETALNSDLPGFARAVVSRDVRSFDGRTVLIPRGSRVIGQYRSGVATGQSRAFIIWSRILRPDGASVQIASSGADPLGRAGLEGKVDRHFFQRFGGAALMSVISAGASAIAGRPSTQVVIGSSQQASGLASSVSPRDISPTIKVQQGSPIQIFVARDLDFSAVGAAGR